MRLKKIAGKKKIILVSGLIFFVLIFSEKKSPPPVADLRKMALSAASLSSACYAAHWGPLANFFYFLGGGPGVPLEY